MFLVFLVVGGHYGVRVEGEGGGDACSSPAKNRPLYITLHIQVCNGGIGDSELLLAVKLVLGQGALSANCDLKI